MLLVVPLAWRNGFFDINRVKVQFILFAVPIFFILFCAVSVCTNNQIVCIFRRGEMVSVFLTLTAFLLSCTVSSAMQGFSQETLFGTDGRLCGLLFLLCCGLAFVVIACGSLDGRIIANLSAFAAATVALLGLLHAYGVDPFGFYDRIKQSQISSFLSTIGNIDFFGAYLSMMFPVAAAQAVFAPKRVLRILLGTASFFIACGVFVSRSDSAILSLVLGSLSFAALCSDDFESLGRALMLLSCSFLSWPLAESLLEYGKWEIQYSGVLKLLTDKGIPWVASSVFLMLSGAAFYTKKRCFCPPGSQKMCWILIVSLLTICILMLSAIFCLTEIWPQIDLGEAENIFRFSDQWGTRRGFVYRRAILAYSDYSAIERLFGKGVDCTARILSPYFDDRSMLRYGIFNDAHCHPLQFLLTTGVMGAGAFLTLYGLILHSCLRRASGDAILTGVSALLFAYIPVCLLGATQPIIISTYFSAAALAVSRMNHLATKEEEP